MTMRVILSGKIMIQGKSQCSVVDIRPVQLTVFKVYFHLKVETGFVASSKMLSVQARRICHTATVKCHSSKGPVTGCLPKRQSHRLGDWFVGCCVN